MGLLIAGIVVLIIAAIVHSYCGVGIKCSAVNRPMFFDDVHPSIPHLIWIIPFATGISLLFIYNWIAGLVGLFVYWLIMPLVITPIMRRWMLPSWDELPEGARASLRRMGYNESNYLEGDWWKRDECKSHLAQKSIEEGIKDTICKDYEEADNLAKEAWERVKKARKKKERGTLEEAINEFSKAMEQVYKAWPPVVEELEIRVDTSANKNAFAAGYVEAKGIMQKAGIWVDPSVNKGECSPYWYAVLRGDHVASRTLYKAARIFPY